jgi:hypothetical protein
MANKFQMVDVDFGKDADKEINEFIEQQLGWLEDAHRELHMNKIPKWRKIYLGTPAEASRNFPFPNAANTVVQVVGETVDTMVARVMGLVYATHPLWTFSNFAREKEMEKRKKLEERKRMLEDFMDIVGLEPNELNLQPVEALWWTDATKLGTGFVKVGYEHLVEAVVVGYEEGKKVKGKDRTIYDGPTVTNLRHEDVLADPSVDSLDKSAMVAVRRKLYRTDLEDRAFREIYSKSAVDSVMGSPDRSTQRQQERDELQDQGIAATSRPEVTAEWDVYECHFPWWHNGRKFRLIYSYHKKTRTVLRKVFNFLPNNELPVKKVRLGNRTNGQYGHGYAELLDNYQEELSTTHNQRLDNATVANIRALRVSPRARALDANMELYPSGLLVGEKDEIEAIQIGDVYPSTYKNEEMTLGLVARRAGITPAVSGSGTGGMMKRPAVYSAQGTMAVMQENNSVVGFATAEFRAAHAALGSLVTAMYGRFGTGGREEMFGINGEALQEAFKDFEDNRIRIPMRATTGSLNKEIDKQTGVILAGLLQRHYTAVSQMMQAVNNPMIDPKTKNWMIQVIVAAEQLHKKIVKDFGYEQPDLFVPEAQTSDGADQQANQGAQMAPGGVPMGGAGGPQPGGAGGPVPQPGMGGGGGGPVPNQR